MSDRSVRRRLPGVRQTPSGPLYSRRKGSGKGPFTLGSTEGEGQNPDGPSRSHPRLLCLLPVVLTLSEVVGGPLTPGSLRPFWSRSTDRLNLRLDPGLRFKRVPEDSCPWKGDTRDPHVGNNNSGSYLRHRSLDLKERVITPRRSSSAPRSSRVPGSVALDLRPKSPSLNKRSPSVTQSEKTSCGVHCLHDPPDSFPC